MNTTTDINFESNVDSNQDNFDPESMFVVESQSESISTLEEFLHRDSILIEGKLHVSNEETPSFKFKVHVDDLSQKQKDKQVKNKLTISVDSETIKALRDLQLISIREIAVDGNIIFSSESFDSGMVRNMKFNFVDSGFMTNRVEFKF
jgi:hypothetical protein